jgi:hypothetical protein
MMWVVGLIFVFVLLLFLAGAIYTLLSVYICDNHTCKAFKNASRVAPVGSPEYNKTLLQGLYSDGMWPLAFIGAMIGAFFSIWLVGGSMTIVTYAILFLVWFLVLYFMFSFTVHHYVDPIIESIEANSNISFCQCGCGCRIDTKEEENKGGDGGFGGIQDHFDSDGSFAERD